MYVIAKIPEVLRFMFSKKEITSNLDFPITMIIIILIMMAYTQNSYGGYSYSSILRS